MRPCQTARPSLRKSPLPRRDSIKIGVLPCENEIQRALPRAGAPTIADRSKSLGVMNHNYIFQAGAGRRAAISPGGSFFPAAPAGRIPLLKQSQAAQPLLST